VVIDRIPFPRPDDPLLTARQRAVSARRQRVHDGRRRPCRAAAGPGRRPVAAAPEDRGVVAVLDSRMATARYGGFLRASLPPFWTTTDPARVKDALQRLRTPATP
jgi:ATP-dependent DNA helicase DinG